MRLKIGLCSVVMIALISTSASLVFSADEITAGTSPREVQAASGQPSVLTEESTEAQDPLDLQWVWAEVVALHPERNQLTLKYLDYDADTEKEMVMDVDGKTAYENVKSLSDIKVGDAVSVDYLIDTSGNNIARNINVEKAEVLSPAAAQEEVNPEPAKTAQTTEVDPNESELPAQAAKQ